MHKILRIPQNKGSLGIPDIKLYYEAVNLVNALRILNSSHNTPWMILESMNITEYSPKDLFWIPKKLRHLLHLSNPFLINTLNIWNSWKSKLICQYSPSTPLSSIDWQSPDLKKVIETWKTHGVSKLKDILVKTSVITKRELEEKTESNLMWLHYFQLRSRLDQRDIQEHLQGGGGEGRHLLIYYWLLKMTLPNINCQRFTVSSLMLCHDQTHISLKNGTGIVLSWMTSDYRILFL